MNVGLQLFWKNPIQVNDVTDGSSIVIELPFGAMIKDPTGGSGGGAVQSVNGKVGHVVLNNNDVGSPSNQQFTDLQDYTNSQFQSIDNSLNTLNSTTTTLRSDVDSLLIRTNDVELDLASLTNTVTNNTNDIDALELHVTNIDSDVSGLNTRVSNVESGLTTQASQITDLQNNKLDRSEYVQHFLGVYPSYSALTTAHPTANDGDYAHIDSGSGFDRMAAIWDSSDTKWVVQDVNVGSNTDEIPEGSTNLYFTQPRVRNTPLTGFYYGGDFLVTDTDSILDGFAKLQGQLLAFPYKIMDTVLESFSLIDNTITGTDTIRQAFGKLQGQLNQIGNKVLAVTLGGFSPVNMAVVATDTLINGISKLQGQINYILGLNQISDFNTAAQNVSLNTYTVGANTPVSSTDSIVGAFGKVQGQINNVPSVVRSTPLTGLSPSAGTIVATDTVLQGFNKAQGNFNSLVVNWVNATTIGTFHAAVASNTLQFAKINGVLHVRGSITTSNLISAGSTLFTFSDKNYYVYAPSAGQFSSNFFIQFNTHTQANSIVSMRGTTTGRCTNTTEAATVTESITLVTVDVPVGELLFPPTMIGRLLVP